MTKPSRDYDGGKRCGRSGEDGTSESLPARMQRPTKMPSGNDSAHHAMTQRVTIIRGLLRKLKLDHLMLRKMRAKAR